MIVDAEEGGSEASNINDQQPPRILLLLPTTTYRAEAFVSAARQMDVEVTVGSEQPNALARLNPTAFLTLDFHDPDHAARQVADFAATYPIHAVVPVDDQLLLPVTNHSSSTSMNVACCSPFGRSPVPGDAETKRRLIPAF